MNITKLNLFSDLVIQRATVLLESLAIISAA